jgi:hypothetical protein
MVYSNIENLLHLTGFKLYGPEAASAGRRLVLPCMNAMGYWNMGFGGIGSVFIGLAEMKKIKLDLYPHFINNIPFFHHSIIP